MATKRKPNSRKKSRADAGDALLQAVLKQVVFDGWSRTALLKGAASIGQGEGHVRLVWPNGVRDAVAQFSAWADARMLDGIANDKIYASRRVRDRVAEAAWLRLEALHPHQEAMRSLYGWALMPHRAPWALRHLYDTCDAIWRAAGDASTDFNFYSKRGLLAWVLKTTTLFWLADESADKAASRAFLDRRIDEVLRLGKIPQTLKSLPEDWRKFGFIADMAKFFQRAG